MNTYRIESRRVGDGWQFSILIGDDRYYLAVKHGDFWYLDTTVREAYTFKYKIFGYRRAKKTIKECIRQDKYDYDFNNSEWQ
jgi:hypothetical protein